MKNGGQAFPVQDMRGDEPGMTLRDYFRGQALAGLLASGAVLAMSPEEVARKTSELADAMLAEREKTE